MQDSSATHGVSIGRELESAVLDRPVRVELDPQLVGHGLDLRVGHVDSASLPDDGGVGGSSVADQEVVLGAIVGGFHVEARESQLKRKKPILVKKRLQRVVVRPIRGFLIASWVKRERANGFHFRMGVISMSQCLFQKTKYSTDIINQETTGFYS